MNLVRHIKVLAHGVWASQARSPRTALRALLLAMAIGVGACAADAVPLDMTGPWELARPVKALRTEDHQKPPLTSKGLTLYQEHQQKNADPIQRCLPPGVPRAMMQPGFPFSIVAGKTLVGMMIQWNHLPRVIYMDRDHFENIGPEYLGQSVGHWDGDTLVVDTTGYNDATWLDDSGLPHSDALHTLERIRLTGANTLEDKITFDDPTVFTKPWTAAITFVKKPGAIIQEDYCFGRMGIKVTVK